MLAEAPKKTFMNRCMRRQPVRARPVRDPDKIDAKTATTETVLVDMHTRIVYIIGKVGFRD